MYFNFINYFISIIDKNLKFTTLVKNIYKFNLNLLKKFINEL